MTLNGKTHPAGEPGASQSVTTTISVPAVTLEARVQQLRDCGYGGISLERMLASEGYSREALSAFYGAGGDTTRKAPPLPWSPQELRTGRGRSKVSARKAEPGTNPHRYDSIAWHQWEASQGAAEKLATAVQRRRVDLTPYLDGSYTPPVPSVGEHRDCGHQMLYPGRWHTVVALNASGKSWFALWHVVGELRAGHTVAYAHFEETHPGGTIARLRLMAPDLSVEALQERFVWLDCSSPWTQGEFARALPEEPSLVVLDGINAAASQHGYDASDIKAPGAYRGLFVTPSVKAGAAVLSLGHPPKAKDRQGERHGFGSTAWLDEVDGVGFRMEAAKKKPIRRGQDGYSMLYVVKDRYGQVEELGALDEERDAGWYKLGAFHVDSTEEGRVRARLGVVDVTPEGEQKDRVDHLADAVLELLALPKHSGRFGSQRELATALKAAKVAFTASDLAPALERLVDRGQVVYPEVSGRNKPRPGWLAPAVCDSGQEDWDLA